MLTTVDQTDIRGLVPHDLIRRELPLSTSGSLAKILSLVRWLRGFSLPFQVARWLRRAR